MPSLSLTPALVLLPALETRGSIDTEALIACVRRQPACSPCLNAGSFPRQARSTVIMEITARMGMVGLQVQVPGFRRSR